MSSITALSCPFCHHKAEYRDAPPGSTVRCLECDCIFRVPANAGKHGHVVKGETISTGRGKHKAFAVIVLLLLLVGGGVYWYMNHDTTKVPPFANLQLDPEGTAPGTLQRFLEAWKLKDIDLMLEHCRTLDRGRGDWAKQMFENVQLESYRIESWSPVSQEVLEASVVLDGMDRRTKISKPGTMKPRVQIEKTAEGKDVWLVDLQYSAPRWRD